MCRHIDFCSRTDCYACDPLWCAKRLVKKAEVAAAKENAVNAGKIANTHWNQIAPTLKCSLCEKTKETWKPKTGQAEYKWYERQYKTKSITLCPTCGTGLWYSHGPTKWETLEPAYKCQHSSTKSTWERGKHKLIATNIKILREENLFSEVTDEQVNKILEQKGHLDAPANSPTKPPSEKRKRSIEPSSKTSKATQQVAITWKEDMEMKEYNKHTGRNTRANARNKEEKENTEPGIQKQGKKRKIGLEL
jgi:hypothetical protein